MYQKKNRNDVYFHPENIIYTYPKLEIKKAKQYQKVMELKKRGLRICEIAKISNIPISRVSIWFNGRKPLSIKAIETVQHKRWLPISTNSRKFQTILDIGCGEGFYAIYLASKGFEVIGIDISETAIKLAKENATKQGVKIKFIAMNIEDLDKLNEKFAFIFEWALLHNIIPERRLKYIEDIKRILNKKGKYLSICFNDQNPDFGAKGKKLRIVPEGAKMPTGTKLYYSSFEEMKQLFEPHFHIIEAKLIKMTAGKKEHIRNYFFMEKCA